MLSHVLKTAKTYTHTHTHINVQIFFHLTQLKHSDMSGSTFVLGNEKYQESGERTELENGRVGVREERLHCNAIEEQFVMLVHMHTGPQSPSAHIISSLLVTSTKTKRSRMLQMYCVGGIIKSNPSQSQSYLPKDTKQSCMHSWYMCTCVCVHTCVLLYPCKLSSTALYMKY